MYSTDNEEKLVVAEKFIKTLKTKTYKYMSSISKIYIYIYIYIDKLGDVISKYNQNEAY